MTAQFEAFLTSLTLPRLETYQRIRLLRDREAIRAAEDHLRLANEGASWLPEVPDGDYAETLLRVCEQVAADQDVIVGLLAEKRLTEREAA